MKIWGLAALMALFSMHPTFAQEIEVDTFAATESQSEIAISLLRHGSLLFTADQKAIYVDPVGMFGVDYSKLPKADLLIITHEHKDHYDAQIVRTLLQKSTDLVVNSRVYEMIQQDFTQGEIAAEHIHAMKNGDSYTWQNLKMTAVPAYNTTPERSGFHPKGRDNGFLLDFPGRRIYVSGDTEDIPEMTEIAKMGPIDVAFLAMNQPYTMTPEQGIRATQVLQPKILYPYHFGDSDLSSLAPALKDSNVELRMRQMK